MLLLDVWEMDPPRGEPRCFVISAVAEGGIPYYRKLQNREFRLRQGVLHTNDVDCQLSGALADMSDCKPFEVFHRNLMIRLWN